MEKQNNEIAELFFSTIQKVLKDYRLNNNQLPPQLIFLDYPNKEVLIPELRLLLNNIESRFGKPGTDQITNFFLYIAGDVSVTLKQCSEINDIILSSLAKNPKVGMGLINDIYYYLSEITNFLFFIIKESTKVNIEFYLSIKRKHPDLLNEINKLKSLETDSLNFDLLLKRGMKSHLVKLIQENLKLHGLNIIVDGDFGKATEFALKNFQRKNSPTVSGIVDTQTWETLIKKIEFKPESKRKPLEKKNVNKEVKIEAGDSIVINYWWINANPNKWKVEDFKIGDIQTYSLYGSKGVKRRLAKNFSSVKKGEKGVVFQSAPARQVMAEIEIVKGIEDEINLNETIEFKITQHFPKPISWETLDSDPLFDKLQSRKYKNLGSLFKVTEGEYKRIIELSQTSNNNKLLQTQTQLISDVWAEKDKLGYEKYAKTIYEIIKDEKSQPPLTIAIIAPWGHGKTTMMKYVERHFNRTEENNKKAENIEEKVKKSWISRLFTTKSKINKKASSTFEDFKSWMNNPIQPFFKFKSPTIWFNPWRYQSSEQIWAGLAHAIISQLAKKLGSLEKERFWFQLRLNRIDVQAIRKDFHKLIINKLLPSFMLFIVAIISVVFFYIGDWDLLIGYLFGGILTTTSIIKGVIAYYKILNRKVEGKFSRYIKEPDYEGKLGLFYEVNKDLENVFTNLVQKEAVIFIDDLDRCSPKVVAEVFEAINMLLNSPFGKNCYFIIGMDAQMVAASLDVEYANLQGKFKVIEDRLGSIGWYFLDKFIQLPFFIPIMDSAKQKKYLEELFSGEKPILSDDLVNLNKTKNLNDPNLITDDKKAEISKDARIILKSNDAQVIKEIVTRRGAEEKNFINAIIEQGVKDITEDSKEIKESIVEFADYLNFSPRALKRFANLIKFYTIQQKLRMLNEPGSIVSTRSLAKWLIINQGWPQLIRWVQWDREEHLCKTTIPKVKAGKLDSFIKDIRKDKENHSDFEKCFDSWLNKISCEDENHLSWLRDKNLFKLLFEKHSEESTLVNALKYNVW
jgi:hypothetical protein